ncbi:protein of unknown function DUF84 [Reticulomyxa filosa]|uniref:inosine/xanthosine triphosphatase n=1 Tax=Reticulomyxa filosa TaxID=46433 RepID=X6N886_RETFI|nr:protein of unknown function DUF84 [Reticulomyxa filosa]|eukprot:ETO22128.1 protein of unknown function DUF84 [Reticulomyxa filosa]
MSKLEDTEKKEISFSILFPSVKTVVVGTTSPLKLGAIEESFQCKANKLMLVGKPIPSQVDDQPVGEAKTKEGAMNRCNGSIVEVPFADMWIGIESGMMNDPNNPKRWIDKACYYIAVLKSGAKVNIENNKSKFKAENHPNWFDTYTCWSDELEIPSKDAEDCLNKDGKSAHKTWSPLKDPHIEICKRSRKLFLRDGLNQWLKEIQSRRGT